MSVDLSLIIPNKCRSLRDKNDAKKCFNNEYKTEPIIDAILRQFDARSIMNLYKIAMDDFTMSSFDSDIRFQTALLSIYQRLIMGI